MKRKKGNGVSQPVTKQYLDKRFAEFGNKVDQKFVALETKIDFKLESLERKVDEKAQQYRDEVLTKIDGVMGELQTMREENIIGSNQITRLNDHVDNHEKRIKILESSQKS